MKILKTSTCQINLKSLKKKFLEIYTYYLKKILLKLKLKFINVSYSFYSLPTFQKSISLLKSPHVYKKAQEQFQFKRYSLIIKISASNSFLLKFLYYLISNKPAYITVNFNKKSICN
jgi:ribosomal protein S10